MKVVFLGTPEFAVPTLAALADRHEVALVVTQPDRPKGRGRHLAAPPAKRFALERGLPVIQPERLDEAGLRPHLERAAAEVAVVAAYGLRLPDWLIFHHPRGMLNVHGSLLPAYRGASPVNRAVMNGDAETGITTMVVAPKMDTGAILLQRSTPIGPEETAGELMARLAWIGAELLIETLDALAAGTLAPRPQENALATLAPKLRKGDGRIDWGRPAQAIVNLVRGVNPWPGAFTLRDGEVLKVWKAAVAPGGAGAAPGTVLAASPREGLVVAAGDGAVSLLLVQAEGKKAHPAAEYLLGHPLAPGGRLG